MYLSCATNDRYMYFCIYHVKAIHIEGTTTHYKIRPAKVSKERLHQGPLSVYYLPNNNGLQPQILTYLLSPVKRIRDTFPATITMYVYLYDAWLCVHCMDDQNHSSKRFRVHEASEPWSNGYSRYTTTGTCMYYLQVLWNIGLFGLLELNASATARGISVSVVEETGVPGKNTDPVIDK